MGTDATIANYIETLTPDEIIARYNEKLKLYCDNIDPYQMDVTECSVAIEDLPNITEHQIFSYLMLSTCPYSGRVGERRESLDYKNPSRTGEVTKVYIKNLDDITIILGEVLNAPYVILFPFIAFKFNRFSYQRRENFSIHGSYRFRTDMFCALTVRVCRAPMKCAFTLADYCTKFKH